MKIRSDFVSNSSSSSFIVKADKNTPEIFQQGGEKITFSEYADRFLERDVFECFYDVSNSWINNKTSYKIIVIPDKQFVSEYLMYGGLPEFWLPECCSEYIDSIAECLEKILIINEEPIPTFFENGQKSIQMSGVWTTNQYRRKLEERQKLKKIFSKLLEKIKKLLNRHMNKWKFWYNELGDMEEPRGFDDVEKTKWYRIFSNH